MLGWSIVLGVLVLFIVIGVILSITSYALDEFGVVLAGISVIIAFIILVVGVLVYFEIKSQINSFNNYQTMVNEVYTNGEIEDTAINMQIIVMNKWLADAKGKEETYGIFSFYHDKLDDLEYITLE